MKTILVVDDNKWLRDLLSMKFSSLFEDCRVKTAEDGARAAEIFDSSSVDLILTDLSMPFMDGYQLIEHIRARSSEIPIIAMTADAGPDIQARLASLGVAKCFEKPFDLPEVAREIASALELPGSAQAAKSAQSVPSRAFLYGMSPYIV